MPVGADFKEADLTTDTQSGAHGASTDLTALSGGAAGSTGGENRHSPEELRDLVLDSLDDSKASDVVTIDLAGKSPIADHMVIATGTSTRQVVTIAEKLVEKLKQDAKIVPRLEGVTQGDWALIDAGDIIIHIFRPEVREFYNLERMWTDTGEPVLHG
jgi:ribosome-associated protein